MIYSYTAVRRHSEYTNIPKVSARDKLGTPKQNFPVDYVKYSTRSHPGFACWKEVCQDLRKLAAQHCTCTVLSVSRPVCETENTAFLAFWRASYLLLLLCKLSVPLPLLQHESV